VVCHFNANLMEHYTLGVPYGGSWREVLNSDDSRFGGSGQVNGKLKAAKEASHGQAHSIAIRLAPLAVQVFEGENAPGKEKGKGTKGKAEKPVSATREAAPKKKAGRTAGKN
jgi:1,4-alpha-glucan branching enzyme